jgi:predicted transcriptional regulator
MKRTTINLPDDLAALLDHERRVRDVSATTIVREALEQYLASAKPPRRIPFAAIGESDGRESIAANAEEILEREWAAWIEEDSGLRPRAPQANPEAIDVGSESNAASGA